MRPAGSWRARVPFVLLRMTASSGVVATLVLICVTAAASFGALAAYDARMLRSAAQQQLTAAQPVVLIRGDQTSSADLATQAAQLRAQAAGLPVAGSVTGAVSLDTLALPDSTSASPRQAVVASLAGIAAHATLTSGRWPESAVEDQGSKAIPAAVPENTASALGLHVNSVLTLRETAPASQIRLLITGLYRPREASDPFWQLTGAGASGLARVGPFSAYGPFDVSAGVFGGGPLTANRSDWIVQIAPAALAAGDAQAEERAAEVLAARVLQSPAFDRPQIADGFPAVLEQLDTAQRVAASALECVGIAIAALAFVALVLGARPLGGQRAGEASILGLRGRARPQALRADLVEAVSIGVLAVIVGAPLGIGFAALVDHDKPASLLRSSTFTRLGPWEAAAGAGALCVLVLLVGSLSRLRANAGDETAARPSRVPGFTRAGVDIALLALAGAACWELRDASGASPLNLLTVLTPALCLLAISALALRLLALLGRIGERVVARGRRLGAALTLWQIARRAGSQAAVTALAVLALGSGTFAMIEHASLGRSLADQSTYAAGAQVRIDLPASTAEDAAVTAVEADHQVRSATPVVAAGGAGGSTVLGLDAATAPSTVLLSPDVYTAATPDSLFSPLRTNEAQTAALPGRAEQLTVSASLRATVSAATLTLVAQDAWGRVLSLAPQALPADGMSHTLDFPVSRAVVYPLHLTAVRIDYQAPAAANDEGVLTLGLPSGTVADLGSWAGTGESAALADGVQVHLEGAGPAVAVPAAGAAPTRVGDSWAFSFETGYGQATSFSTVGLVTTEVNVPAKASMAFAPSAQAPLPALATAAFLSSTRLGIGSQSEISPDGVSIPVRIVGRVADFPTVDASAPGGALIVDVSALQARLVELGQPPLPLKSIWLDTADDAAPAALPAGASVVTLDSVRASMSADPDAQAVRRAYLALAAGAAVLAAVGLLGAVAAEHRERRRQRAVLAALGLPVRRGVAVQTAERLTTGLVAALAGVVGGWLVARVLTPFLILTDAGARPTPAVADVVPPGQVAALLGVVVVIPAVAAGLAALRRPDIVGATREAEES
ncbi:FtsX-like permease family protein [Actinospica robiniae]|uniref:FtsX-like permease family protein n=1 Tax=Actinospica robiniae TaxID=304901 RepID=UPI000412D3E2|nr:FtsX-like permease family protein [Actinospica robiniae]